MTIFATQNSNLVFASPDGSNGTPDFRALTVNDLPSTKVITPLLLPNTLSITCNIIGTYYYGPQFNANTFAYVANVALPNTISKDALLEITISGNTTAANVGNASAGYYTGGPTLEYQLRIGPNGNSSDPIVFVAPNNINLFNYTTPYGQSPYGPTNFNQLIFGRLSANGANSQLAISSMFDQVYGNNYASNVVVTSVDLSSNQYLTITMAATQFGGVPGITSDVHTYSNVNFNIVAVREI